MAVTVRYVGVPISARLAKLPSFVAAMRTRYLIHWAGQIVLSMRMNIDESRAPDGSLHLALKHPRGKGHNQDNHPLKDSGALYESIQYLPAEPVNQVWIGATAVSKRGFPYPIVHNQGYPKGDSSISARIPRRRFAGLRDADRLMIDNGREAAVREIFGELNA